MAHSGNVARPALGVGAWGRLSISEYRQSRKNTIKATPISVKKIMNLQVRGKLVENGLAHAII